MSVEKQYAIPKYFQIVVYLMLLCMITFSLFIKGIWSSRHPVELTQFNMDKMKSGQIVRFSMDSFCVNEHGVDQWLGLKETYFEYAIPMGSRYVLTAFYEKSTLERVRSYVDGRGTPMMILGRIVPIEHINEEKYRMILGSDFERLNQGYIILQVTEEELTKKSLRYLGITGILALLAMVLLLGMGGIYRGKEVPFEESSQYKEYRFKIRYHLEDYLRREKETIAELRRQQALAPKKILRYALACILSVIVFMVCLANCSENVMLVYPMILGICVLWGGLRKIGRTMLDMDFKVSRNIAKKFGLLTLPIRIEQSSILIGLLNRRMAEQEAQERQGQERQGQEGQGQEGHEESKNTSIRGIREEEGQ